MIKYVFGNKQVRKNEAKNWFWILSKDLQCKSIWSGEKEVTEENIVEPYT